MFWIMSGTYAHVEVRCIVPGDGKMCATTVGLLDTDLTSVESEDWLVTDSFTGVLNGSEAAPDGVACIDARYMAVNHAEKVRQHIISKVVNIILKCVE